MNKYTKYIPYEAEQIYAKTYKYLHYAGQWNYIALFFYMNAFKQTQMGRAWSCLAGTEKDKPNCRGEHDLSRLGQWLTD